MPRRDAEDERSVTNLATPRPRGKTRSGLPAPPRWNVLRPFGAAQLPIGLARGRDDELPGEFSGVAKSVRLRRKIS
jgi:hypothetical protein